jgi:hypothetical protein
MTHSTWISREEVQQLTGWARRTVFLKQANGTLKTRAAKEKTCNGKTVLEYDAASLPSSAQLRLMEQKMAACALVPIQQSISAVASLPEPKSERTILALESLDDEARAQAQQRLQIIGPMIDFVNRTNGHKPLFRATSGEEFTTLSGVVLHLSSITGFTQSRIWEW